MNIEKTPDGIIKINLKRIQIILGIIVLIAVQFIQPIFGLALSKNAAETTIINHEKRIVILENNEQSTHELLLEIKFNLRAFMKTQGQDYIDSGRDK